MQVMGFSGAFVSLHLYSDMSLPHLGFAWYSSPMTTPRNPFPTVDVIIELEGSGIVLIRRKNPPPGWALPGGFIDYGESAEAAAVREAKEETSLDVQVVELL